MWTIIGLSIGGVLLVLVILLVYFSWKKFHDRSVDIKEGMNEQQVLEVMEKDPIEILPLKKGLYEWVYERKEYKGWAMMIIKIEIIFDAKTKLVKSIEKNVSYDRQGIKKE